MAVQTLIRCQTNLQSEMKQAFFSLDRTSFPLQVWSLSSHVSEWQVFCVAKTTSAFFNTALQNMAVLHTTKKKKKNYKVLSKLIICVWRNKFGEMTPQPKHSDFYKVLIFKTSHTNSPSLTVLSAGTCILTFPPTLITHTLLTPSPIPSSFI